MNNEQATEQAEEETAAGEHQEQSVEDGSTSGQASQVEQLQAELSEMKDQWMRAVAENENLHKRAARDQAETRKYAVGEFARDLINVAENLYRALGSITPDMLEAEEHQVTKTLYDGVEMTRSELLHVFERHGLVRIMPERGDAFDHNVHQAVSQIEDAGVEDGTIAQVIQAGYRMHDRLLQPSMVAVAKSTTETPPTVDTTA